MQDFSQKGTGKEAFRFVLYISQKLKLITKQHSSQLGKQHCNNPIQQIMSQAFELYVTKRFAQICKSVLQVELSVKRAEGTSGRTSNRRTKSQKKSLKKKANQQCQSFCNTYTFFLPSNVSNYNSEITKCQYVLFKTRVIISPDQNCNSELDSSRLSPLHWPSHAFLSPCRYCTQTLLHGESPCCSFRLF